MAEYEDNSVAESGAVKGFSEFAVKSAKLMDFLSSALSAGAIWSAIDNTVRVVASFFTFGLLKPGIMPESAQQLLDQAGGAFNNPGAGVAFAGVVGAARGVEAVSELSKGNKLKAANITIKGAVEAAVVYAEIGYFFSGLGLLAEPLSFLMTGKALSTNLGEVAAKVAENVEETFISSSAKKKAEAKIDQVAAATPVQQPAPSFAQQAAPIMMVPMMMAQNMAPATLPSQPVIQPQMMPYVVQQAVTAPNGESPKPNGYWVNQVTQNKTQQPVVAAVPQEAAAFNHAVRIAEQKAAAPATAQPTV